MCGRTVIIIYNDKAIGVYHRKISQNAHVHASTTDSIIMKIKLFSFIFIVTINLRVMLIYFLNPSKLTQSFFNNVV